MAQHGFFHWNELLCGDVDAAKAFYGETLGWSFTAMPMKQGNYWIASIGAAPVAGLMDIAATNLPSGSDPFWMSYIAVDDVDGRVTKVEPAGGKVLHEVFEVPGVGRIALIEDASGAMIGWITPAS
ncbi:MAG TPA: VOC family protein [Hyphomicrobiales bacterium]|nr:VOC family protein [Rhodobiaceae bacterium]HXK54687.1 VOC family protein [Hyphomicrobiales bacterium]